MIYSLTNKKGGGRNDPAALHMYSTSYSCSVRSEVLLVKVKILHSECFSYCLHHEYYNHELYPLTCAIVKNHMGLGLANEEATISCLLL
jgi:hypothetical protein